MEELELEIKESMDANEETLDRCCGISIVSGSFERW
jgi:hypothetical protein